jgi:hypothetical protein
LVGSHSTHHLYFLNTSQIYYSCTSCLQQSNARYLTSKHHPSLHIFKRFDMRIQVQTLGSGSVDFDIQESDTVAHVKKLLEEKEGISPEQLRLVAKGKVLRDNETLTAGTSIKVILVVRGGSCSSRA